MKRRGFGGAGWEGEGTKARQDGGGGDNSEREGVVEGSKGEAEEDNARREK